MSRVMSLTVRVVRQVLRDRRTLALFFLAPVLILTLLWVVLSNPLPTPRLAATSLPSSLVQSLQRHAQVRVESSAKAQHSLGTGRSDGWIEKTAPHRYVLTVSSVDPAITNRLKTIVKSDLAAYNVREVIASLPKTMDTHLPLRPSALTIRYRHSGSTFSSFNQMAPALLVLFIFFFAFLVPGIAFLRERVGGTLERLFASPLRTEELVLGYLIGFGIFAILQTVVLQGFATLVLGIQSAGSFVLVVGVGLLVALSALSLGIALSGLARTEFQIMQFIPLVIVPQILFSGLFSLRSAPVWTRYLSDVLPLTYGISAMKKVMLENSPVSGILGDLARLCLFLVAFMMINVIFLRPKGSRE